MRTPLAGAGVYQLRQALDRKGWSAPITSIWPDITPGTMLTQVDANGRTVEGSEQRPISMRWMGTMLCSQSMRSFRVLQKMPRGRRWRSIRPRACARSSINPKNANILAMVVTQRRTSTNSIAGSERACRHFPQYGGDGCVEPDRSSRSSRWQRRLTAGDASGLLDLSLGDISWSAEKRSNVGGRITRTGRRR